MRHPLRTLALPLAGVLLLLTGCASAATGEVGQNYVSGDGTVTEFASGNRGEPVDFAGVTDANTEVAARDYRGEIVVINFWYASCPPCRVEAPWLQQLSDEFESDGVIFLGVNIRDGAETSLAFAQKFGISYPSIIDTDGAVALAFAGIASPTAVPTTVVLDRDGRPSARIVGLLKKSTLKSLIQSALDEAPQ